MVNLVAAIEARGGYAIDPSQLVPGDVIATSLVSGHEHAVFVVSGTGTGCRIAAHTVDHCNYPSWGYALCLHIPSDAAHYISGMETFPDPMAAGRSYNVSITMQNTGSTTWTKAEGYKLGAVDGYNGALFGGARHELADGEAVGPGASKTFAFTVTAPGAFTYCAVWQMVREGVHWFGDQPNKTITVVDVNDADVVSSTIPSTMLTGQSYSVSVTMKNTGSTTWTQANEYKLGAVNDTDPFGPGRIVLGASDSIAPNASKTFSWTMTAPMATGSYITDWRMLRENVEWFGQTHSRTVTVSLSPPVITQHPASQSKCAGETATFTATASGQNLSYRWQFNSADLSNGGHYSGVTTTTLTVSGVDGTVDGNYRCKVSNAGGTVYSNQAVLTLKAATAISAQPVDRKVCPGTTAAFTVSAAGAGTVSYRWQKNGSNLSNGGHYSGVTTATLTVSNASSADVADYRCVVTADCGSVTSSTASLSLKAVTTILQQPADQARCLGDDASFTVAVTGEGTILYQWQKDGISLVDGNGISGTLSPSLQIVQVKADHGGTYRCVVTAECGSQTSGVATLTIYPLTVISGHPADLLLCPGETARFTVVAQGAQLSYQWYKDGTALMDGDRVSGATATTLAIANIQSTDFGDYECMVSGQCGVLTSSPATLTVRAATLITRQPESQQVELGDPVQFGVGASGAGLTYQWKKDGNNLTNGGNISGVYTQLLRLSGVSRDDLGHYGCVVRGVRGRAITIPAELTFRLCDAPRYRHGPVDVNTGGLPMSAGRYRLIGSTAQAGSVGMAASARAAAWIGFWPAALPSLPPTIVPPDFDADGDVDRDDLAHFVACTTGPALGPPYSGCENADLDHDNDVDQADFGLFQRCMSGINVQASPGCME